MVIFWQDLQLKSISHILSGGSILVQSDNRPHIYLNFYFHNHFAVGVESAYNCYCCLFETLCILHLNFFFLFFTFFIDCQRNSFGRPWKSSWRGDCRWARDKIPPSFIKRNSKGDFSRFLAKRYSP